MTDNDDTQAAANAAPDTDDDTQAAEPETTEVPAETAKAAELAWSQDDGSDEPQRKPWRNTSAMAGIIVAVGAALAGGVVFASGLRSHHGVMPPRATDAEKRPAATTAPAIALPAPSTVTVTATSTPAPAAAPTTTAAPTTPTPVLSDTDRQFLATLRDINVNYPYSNPEYPIGHAHAVCDYMNTHHFDWGEDHEGSVDKYVETTTIWYGADAVKFQGSARASYCPSTVNGEY